MQSIRLLDIAIDASVFLERSFDQALSEHIEAVDPSADEDCPYIVVRAIPEHFQRVASNLPPFIETQGCQVEVICRPSQLNNRMN